LSLRGLYVIIVCGDTRRLSRFLACANSANMPFSARGECESASGGKFWNIECNGASWTVTYGKTNTDGATQTKDWDDEDTCVKEAQKLGA
jgi:hypothetical protein